MPRSDDGGGRTRAGAADRGLLPDTSPAVGDRAILAQPKALANQLKNRCFEPGIIPVGSFRGAENSLFLFRGGLRPGRIPSIAKLRDSPVNKRPRERELSGSRVFRKRGKELREAMLRTQGTEASQRARRERKLVPRPPSGRETLGFSGNGAVPVNTLVAIGRRKEPLPARQKRRCRA